MWFLFIPTAGYPDLNYNSLHGYRWAGYGGGFRATAACLRCFVPNLVAAGLNCAAIRVCLARNPYHFLKLRRSIVAFRVWQD
jgi:hypothetical protein